jgi:outer membrane receptor protein involved in Fe transport
LFIDENIPDVLTITENPLPGDVYDGGLNVFSGYGLLDWEASKTVRLSGGLRVEHTDQFVEPKAVPGGDKAEVDGSDLKQTDLLPSVSFIFSGTPKSKTRFSYARTLAGPRYVK